MSQVPFTDRREAGRRLAERLAELAPERPIVLALPRGGVPVGFEVAAALGAPLDVMVARKLGAPGHPEFGVGAIAPGGVRVIDERAFTTLHLSHHDMDQVVADETLEMERRLVLYRGDERPPDVAGRTVVLVDDGLATGVTAVAAVRALRAMRPRRILLAVPVAAGDSVERLRAEADEVVALETPEDFQAVGLWYRDFSQTSDDEVLHLLERARQRTAAAPPPRPEPVAREVRIPVDGGSIVGDLVVPPGARGVVLFAHGSGSGRTSARNRHVAGLMRAAGLGTLLVDLLTEEEARRDEATREHRFDIELLGARLVAAADWLRAQADVGALHVGLYGASTGGAAALVAATARPDDVAAVVSRGGRPDLAVEAIPLVRAPTLLVVGQRDDDVLDLNESVLPLFRREARLSVVAGATHLFEEPGALEEVARLAIEWFDARLAEREAATSPSRGGFP